MAWQAVGAIALVVLAVTGIGLAIAVVAWLRRAGRAAERVARLAELLEREAPPLLAAARSLADDTRLMVGGLRAEISELVAGSRRLRAGIEEAAGALAERARELEVVLDILQEEVEETALDVAAALRGTRRGISLLGALKRGLWRGRG
jgi:methyl-accepting chemotaxis protein